MTVFLVWQSGYECDDLLGVFRNHVDAEKFITDYMNKHSQQGVLIPGSGFSIVPTEVL